MPSIGDTIVGRYELRDTLGACPTRVAYRAYDTEVEVEVTLWCLPAELFPTPSSRAFFIAAAKQTQGIRHRHLLKVFEAGTLKEVPGGPLSIYLTQQLGTSAELEGRLTTGTSSEAAAILRYAESLSGALEAMHDKGLHHGWLTPADVVEVAGQVKLCGVGLFASMDAKAALACWGEDSRYLAPEVLAGRPASAASDTYSLAVILLELAIGGPAHSVSSSLARLAGNAPMQAHALRHALAANPAERPHDSDTFLAAVRQGWADQVAATVEHLAPVNLTAPAPDSGFKPTLAMGQAFVDANIAEMIAEREDTANEMMVSEVVEPTPPPGGFDEGVTSAMVDTPPPGGFDEQATLHSASAMPMGFDEGATLHQAQVPKVGFEDGKTADRPRGKQRPAAPPGPEAAAGMGTPASRAETVALGKTEDTRGARADSFVDGKTEDKVGKTAGSEDETRAAMPPGTDFREDDATYDAPIDPAGGFDEGQTIAESTLPPAGGFDEGATVVDAAPGLRLLALSMKPKSETDSGLHETKPSPPPGIVAKPVLRPLSSLAESVDVPQELGHLAPPRVEKESKPASSRRLWLLMSMFLVSGAATVSLILMFGGSKKDSKTAGPFDAGQTSDASSASGEASLLPRKVVVMGPTCPEGSVHLTDKKLCVDAFEAPGEGRQPQSGLALEEARAACTKREMRLCTGAEWEAACGGANGSRWPYGPRYKPEICNLKGKAIDVAGARAACRSSFAIYDMSGNIAEWVEEGEIRGGSALDRSRGRCSQLRPNPGRQSAFSDVGFRCCADAIASPPPSD